MNKTMTINPNPMTLASGGFQFDKSTQSVMRKKFSGWQKLNEDSREGMSTENLYGQSRRKSSVCNVVLLDPSPPGDYGFNSPPPQPLKNMISPDRK